MATTKIGQKIAGWTSSAKEEFRTDLEKLSKVPFDVLAPIVDKIARTYPACNTYELAAYEGERLGVRDPEELSDVIAAFAFVWDNIGDESTDAVIEDLISASVLSPGASGILTKLVAAARPFRESAKVAADHLRMGSALFVNIRGTVDFRLRFHDTEDEFIAGRLPKQAVGAQQVIMANLTINEPDGEERVVSFLMDDSDLAYLKKFVRNMERELELSKDLIKLREK